MKRFFHFLQFNNLVPIMLFAIFGTSSLALAFDEDVQQAVYSVEEEVVSIDNTYITEVDLDDHAFNLKVTSIREDADFFYVSYTYTTIALVDFVWQDSEVTTVLDVSKKSMVGKDLGLFIARQVSEVINSQLAYLKKVQKIENESGITKKMISKKYSGIVGKLFDAEDQEFPGYKPVVNEQKLAARQAAALAEPFVSQIALPHVPSESDIEKMVLAAYAQMLIGDTDVLSATSTATSTDEGETSNDEDDESNNEPDDTTSSSTPNTPVEEPVDDETSSSTEEVPTPDPEPIIELTPEPESVAEPEPEPINESEPVESSVDDAPAI